MTIEHLVIPAAGIGTRMMDTVPGLPANFPKEMLPVGRKPALQFTLVEGYHAGIRNFTIIVRQGKGIINHLIEKHEYPGGLPMETMNELEEILENSTVNFLYQEKLTGECGAIALAREVVGDKPFAVMYPDNIADPNPGVLKDVIAAYEKHGRDMVCLTTVKDEIKHCVSDSGHVNLEDKGDDIKRIVSIDPAGDSWFEPKHENEERATGIYVASPTFLDYCEKMLPDLDQREELTANKVRRAMIADSIDILALSTNYDIHDMSNPEGFWRCAQAFYVAP